MSLGNAYQARAQLNSASGGALRPRVGARSATTSHWRATMGRSEAPSEQAADGRWRGLTVVTGTVGTDSCAPVWSIARPCRSISSNFASGPRVKNTTARQSGASSGSGRGMNETLPTLMRATWSVTTNELIQTVWRIALWMFALEGRPPLA